MIRIAILSALYIGLVLGLTFLSLLGAMGLFVTADGLHGMSFVRTLILLLNAAIALIALISFFAPRVLRFAVWAMIGLITIYAVLTILVMLQSPAAGLIPASSAFGWGVLAWLGQLVVKMNAKPEEISEGATT